MKKHDLQPLVFHGLRHTSASYLIAQGEDVVTVSNRLGHSNKTTTLNIYAHSFRKRDEEAGLSKCLACYL
ncbi:MAG: tyrosine-type recombinase/integrase [Clostridiales bacterium]|nr:tyrosine-type recombinase/integrase [Clostridiales bacterium]